MRCQLRLFSLDPLELYVTMRMPELYRLFSLYILRMLNFTFASLVVLLTLKKNHWLYPLVLISF